MLPIVRPQQLPALPREKEKKSLIDVFRSKPQELIQAPKEVLEIFRPAQKSVIPIPPVEKKPEVRWEELVPQEAPSAMPIAEFLKPSTIYEASLYPPTSDWATGEPPIYSHTTWRMPSTYELAEYIQRRWDLPGIYEYVLNQVEQPWWRREVFDMAHEGRPAMLDVELLSKSGDPRLDISRFLKIPDAVIELYGRYGPEGHRLFNMEVLGPLLERLGKALDVLRPTPVLRGYFEIEPDPDMNFWLRYKETMVPQLGFR